jgi:hypothetical protein
LEEQDESERRAAGVVVFEPVERIGRIGTDDRTPERAAVP